jgi:hypothetical protein
MSWERSLNVQLRHIALTLIYTFKRKRSTFACRTYSDESFVSNVRLTEAIFRWINRENWPLKRKSRNECDKTAENAKITPSTMRTMHNIREEKMQNKFALDLLSFRPREISLSHTPSKVYYSRLFCLHSVNVERCMRRFAIKRSNDNR